MKLNLLETVYRVKSNDCWRQVKHFRDQEEAISEYEAIYTGQLNRSTEEPTVTLDVITRIK